MKKYILTIIIFLILIISFFLVYPKKNNEILATKENNFDFLSIMLEKETGTGNYSEGESFPQNGYFLNKNLSKCVNGSKIKYENGSIYITGNKTDRCYAYFDKDELGSICKSKNMAECFTKNYKKDSSIIYHDGLCDYEGEENCDLEAGDLSYRYTGGNDLVHNYVCLDGKTESGSCASDADLYRIIGFFPNEEDNYEMKLIKAQGASVTELGDSKVEGGTYYGLYKDYFSSGQSYYYKGTNWENLGVYYWNSSNSTNMWQYSNLNKENLNKYFYNYLTTKVPYLQNHVIEHTWTTGGMSTIEDVKATYELELGKNKVKVNDNVCSTLDNTNKTLPCTPKDIEYTDYIGLIYMSDYMYAAAPTYWTYVGYNSSDATKDYRAAINDNWLYIGINEWSISRNSYNGYARDINLAGALANTYVSSYCAVRPCFYLSFDTKLKEGNGTYERPYRLILK